jgi:hypothetical protein
MKEVISYDFFLSSVTIKLLHHLFFSIKARQMHYHNNDYTYINSQNINLGNREMQPHLVLCNKLWNGFWSFLEHLLAVCQA